VRKYSLYEAKRPISRKAVIMDKIGLLTARFVWHTAVVQRIAELYRKSQKGVSIRYDSSSFALL
jgi:hypothetical protein